MSKVLKFIVHLVVICTILCVIALAVPPFFGITTEIQDDHAGRTNLPMGSVTYAIPVKTELALTGDPVLVTDDDGVSRYNIYALDVASGRGTVIDSTVPNSMPINVSVTD